MQVEIKKIWFYNDFLDDKKNKDIVLFKKQKWYEVQFQTENNIIYLISETGEKIGIDTTINPNLFCLQKNYKNKKGQ